MSRWIVHLKGGEAGVAWARGFFEDFDTSCLEWIRIDTGRGKYEGVYGRCWYPSDDRPTFRISCQVPGPYPCDVVTRKRPLYARADGTFPRAPKGCRRGQHVRDIRTKRQWYRVVGRTRVQTLDEGIAWIIGHEGFHFLRRTRQIPGRDTEIEADDYADRTLERFRGSGAASARKHSAQLCLPFGGCVGAQM